MIAVDSSSLVAFFEGEIAGDTELVDAALLSRQIVLPPVVLTEILSDPKLGRTFRLMLQDLPLLSVDSDYWTRAGELRQKILSKGYKARIADALIAQSCLDHKVSLITRDRDFRNYQKHAALSLESWK